LRGSDAGEVVAGRAELAAAGALGYVAADGDEIGLKSGEVREQALGDYRVDGAEVEV
jgi:hypothetical protein